MICGYVHKFPRFLAGDEHRQCILENGHEDNHVVIDPQSDKPMDVCPGSQPSPTMSMSLRRWIEVNFPERRTS